MAGYVSPAERMLLRRVRESLDALDDEGCQLSDTEIVARGLALYLESLGVSGRANAGMIAGVEAEGWE